MEDTNMLTTEVAIIFKTLLPEQYRVPETQIQLPTSSAAKDLTQILRQLDESEGLQSRKFNFMVNGVFL